MEENEMKNLICKFKSYEIYEVEKYEDMFASNVVLFKIKGEDKLYYKYQVVEDIVNIDYNMIHSIDHISRESKSECAS